MKFFKYFPLKKFTTMAMGGPARYFARAQSEKELLEAIKFGKLKKVSQYIVGEGSNLVANDTGYRGIVIQNKIQKFDLTSSSAPHQERIVNIGAGNNLTETIFRLNSLGLGGLERMAGIPGTVGGAIYGCAGAYGQEIKDHLVGVRIWDGKKFRALSKSQCHFTYRASIFKKNKKWVITEAILKLKKINSNTLTKISREIIELRKKKYKPGLKCPGSFFKNIKISDIGPRPVREKFVKTIGSDKIQYGKVPAGALLEEAGAKGMREGEIRVANHHANLIYNPNGGRSADVKKLAGKLKRLVQRRFGIKMEEEVQYL